MNKRLDKNLRYSDSTKEHISHFLLERYHIGEVTPEEKLQIEQVLKNDEALAAALADIGRADHDFYQRFSQEKFFPAERNWQSIPSRCLDFHHHIRKISKPVWGICAAAMIMIIAIPLFVLRNPAHEEFGYRMKGSIADSKSIELSIYLRKNSAGEIIRLADQAKVREGNTIQLAYRVFAANADEKYGIIFSIDGRSYVTMHYPHAPWQSTLLVSGGSLVPLDAAFILDDAPDYEIFFFLAGDTAMDIINILTIAKELAFQIKGDPQKALQIGTAVFSDYKLTVFTLIKEE